MNIEFINVNLSYGSKKIINNMNAVIPQGEVFCIMGESGSGKTTAVNLLAGILKPDSGKIIGINGIKTSVVFQDERLLPWYSAAGNVSFVAGGWNAYKTGLEDRRNRLFRDLNLFDDMHKNVSELSGGMQRRVSLLRALVADFDLLILDEAFKGLDEVSKLNAMDIVAREACGKTIVLITHDSSDAEYFAKKFKINNFVMRMVSRD